LRDVPDPRRLKTLSGRRRYGTAKSALTLPRDLRASCAAIETVGSPDGTACRGFGRMMYG